jgi:uncharacterized protein (DUF4415 family)
MQMKAGKRVRKTPKKSRGREFSLAAAQDTKGRYVSIEDALGLYKPRKKQITLRLDADVLAWFKRSGDGYQTRINRALRQVMREAR